MTLYIPAAHTDIVAISCFACSPTIASAGICKRRQYTTQRYVLVNYFAYFSLIKML